MLKFGSWTFDGFKIDIGFFDREEIDINDLHGDMTDTFEIIGNSAKKNVKYYPCCEEPYPDLTFMLHLRKIKRGNQA